MTPRLGSACPQARAPRARLYDWAYLELADLDAGKFYPGSDGLWTRGLLVRRSTTDNKLAFFATWCPAGTGADRLVQVEGCRWAIEDSFECAKTELGLDRNETRSWARLAPARQLGHACLRHDGQHPPACEPARPTKNTAAPTQDPQAPALVRWSVQELRRIATRLAQRRIHPAYVIAWSLWQRAHQASAQRSYLKRKRQL